MPHSHRYFKTKTHLSLQNPLLGGLGACPQEHIDAKRQLGLP
nr:hypothetical protein BN341_p100 [Helicobacter heilmannii ASB1.4]